MGNCRRSGVVLAMYFTVIAIFAAGRMEGRELRPSEHGLGYQRNRTATRAEESPEMLSFFGGTMTTSSSPAAASMPFPEAKNMSDTSWWNNVSGANRKDHLRAALVVAALVCGATGVAFLVVAALLFLFQYKTQRSNIRAN